MGGLSAQDSNIQAIFAKGRALMNWPYPSHPCAQMTSGAPIAEATFTNTTAARSSRRRMRRSTVNISIVTICSAPVSRHLLTCLLRRTSANWDGLVEKALAGITAGNPDILAVYGARE